MERNKFNSDIFSERLKQARQQKGLTQQALANLIGVTNVCISDYENTRKNKLPSLDKAYDLANALNVSLDWLCGYECNYMYLMALWTILKRFEPEVKFHENEKSNYKVHASLELKGENSKFSQTEVAKFLKGYVQIREFEKSNILSDTMIKNLEETLLKEFQHIPELAPYDFDKHNKKK